MVAQIDYSWIEAQAVAQAISWPLEKWPGNCYGVASALVNSGIIGSDVVAVYGHWLGPVSPECVVKGWRRPRPFIQHGWVRCPDGAVIDPTRWVFEAVEPYIYNGEADHYDEGGNRFRFATMGPPPDYEGGLWDGEVPDDGYTFAGLDSDTWVALEHLLDLRQQGGGRGYFNRAQVFWLANLPPAMLGEAASPFYRTLDREGLIGLVPFDNRLMVERSEGATK